MMEWETVIGLEVHVQLQTGSKIFSGASTAYGAEPNTQACEFSIALPGVLPVMNREAAKLAVRFGLAINAEINRVSIFARKNYFYPDLPKGYQISQFEAPIVGRGSLEILVKNRSKMIGITRAHLEEDAGKSLHDLFPEFSGIDLNRAGTPLLEIVSEPDIRSAAEAVAYLKQLHALVRYLGISDGNMQEGSFRCDANVSVRPQGAEKLGTRTELKNINSFRFVEKAILFEVNRQIELLEEGGTVLQETRLYDADRDETRSMRSKEASHDYRYFPDPDLPPMVLDDDFLAEVRDGLPELPQGRRHRFIDQFDLTPADAMQLTNERALADYFEAVVKASNMPPRMICHWVIGELGAALNQSDLSIEESRVSSSALAELLNRMVDHTISGKMAKEVFQAMWNGMGNADTIIASRGLKQITDSGTIESLVDEVLASCPDQVQQYRQGNQKVMGYLVGQIMKKTQGKVDPKQTNEILRIKLEA